jgi:hypothetical protein
MDKVKAFLAQLKKHHFWVLGGLVFLFSLTGWYLAAADLEQKFIQNRAKIKSQFDELSKISARVNHPNPTFEEEANKLTALLTRDVEQAWTSIYSEQRDNVLKWPKELGDDYLQMMDAIGPTDDIPVEMRERYLNYIKEEFPRLLQIVDARAFWDRSEDEQQPGGPGLRRRGPQEDELELNPNARDRPVRNDHDYLVIWDKKSQQAVDATLDWPRTPTSQEVRFCQENLWVYHALLDAVAKINKGATGHHNAKIKEIIALATGQDATSIYLEAASTGRLVLPDGVGGLQGAPAGGGMGMGGMPPMAGMPPMGGMPREGMPGAPPGVEGAGLPDPRGGGKLLDDKRYVDEKGMPLPSGSPSPAEFKRMPILMRLWMDQREIDALLVELANSPLPVEIRQFRLNPPKSGHQIERPVVFGGGAADAGGRGGPEVIRRNQNMEESTQFPYDLAVELYGIIYIYNPPDKKIFAQAPQPVEGAPAAAPAEGAAPAAPPAEVKPANSGE